VFPPGTPDAVRRQHPRYAAALQVHVQTVNDLHVLYTRNISKGGLFVSTTLDLPAATTLKVSVIHPKTGVQFPLEAVVRWRAGAPDPGLGLWFMRLTERQRDEFFEFISAEIPVEEVVYVADGDPGLSTSSPDEPGPSRGRRVDR
jgi:PilZ domain